MMYDFTQLLNNNLFSVLQWHCLKSWISKCPPFSPIQLRRRCHHWLTALPMIRWSKQHHSWISRSFKWSRSRSQLDWDPAAWLPVLWPDEVRRLGRQQCNRFASTVSRGIVLLTRFCWCRQLMTRQLDPASSVGLKRCSTADVWYSPFWAHNGRARQSSRARPLQRDVVKT